MPEGEDTGTLRKLGGRPSVLAIIPISNQPSIRYITFQDSNPDWNMMSIGRQLHSTAVTRSVSVVDPSRELNRRAQAKCAD
jgi:hypothetical protein